MRGLPSVLVTVVVGAAALAVAGERHSPRVRPLPSSLAVTETGQTGSENAKKQIVDKADQAFETSDRGACVQRSTGGPDAFGYRFIDSNEPGGPVFQWVDITASGVPTDPLGNNVVGPYPIDFVFSFYGVAFTDFFVASDGYLELGDNDNEPVNQCPLPDIRIPNSIIAIMWDHLLPGTTNDSVFYQSFGAGSCPWGGYPGACLVVLYDDFCHWPGGTACSPAGTWEAILFDDHSIVMQFFDAGSEGGLNSTTGIEGPGGNLGLTYACNTPWSLHDGLAIRFYWTPPPPVVLAAAEPEVDACRRTVGLYELTLVNNTGATSSFDILYSGFDWEVSGEATVGPVEHLGTAVLSVVHRLPDAAVPGDFDTGTVTAQDQAGPGSAGVDITTTVARYLTTTGAAPRPRMDHAFIPSGSPPGDFGVAIGGFGGPGTSPPGAVLPGLPPGLQVSPEATVDRLRLSSWTWHGGAPDCTVDPLLRRHGTRDRRFRRGGGHRLPGRHRPFGRTAARLQPRFPISGLDEAPTAGRIPEPGDLGSRHRLRRGQQPLLHQRRSHGPRRWRSDHGVRL